MKEEKRPRLPPGQALAQGSKKETMMMTSERERGSERRRAKGSETDEDHRPRGAAAIAAIGGLFCFSAFG